MEQHKGAGGETQGSAHAPFCPTANAVFRHSAPCSALRFGHTLPSSMSHEVQTGASDAERPARACHQALRRLHGRARDGARHPARPVLHDARPVGLRQDHDAADGRRLRGAHRGARAPRRRRRDRPAGVQAPDQHRLPELRALPAPERRAERGVRAPAPEGRQGRDPPPRGRGARARRPRRARRSAGPRSSRAASSSASPSRARS